MSRNQFFQILRYLHVSDDSVIVPTGQTVYDKLHKIKPSLKLLFPNFKKAYDLHKNFSIDEHTIPCRGHLSFQEFVANKPICFGIEAWVLADLESKYTCKTTVYGKKPKGKGRGGFHHKGGKRIVCLVGGFWSSFVYWNFLHQYGSFSVFIWKKNYACGTSKGSRKNFPREIVFERAGELARGRCQWQMCESLLAATWLDNKAVYFCQPFTLLEFPVRATAYQGLSGAEGQECCSPFEGQQQLHGWGWSRRSDATLLHLY